MSSILQQAVDILDGHVKELLGANSDLSEQRLNICKQCAIYKPQLGGICDSSKYVSPDGSEWSLTRKTGYIRGCGCRLAAKSKLPHGKCPVGLW